MSRPRLGVTAIAAALTLVGVPGCAPEADRGAAVTDSVLAREQGDDQSEAQLPDQFPADFPLPEDLVITEGRYTEGDAYTQPNFFVRGTSTLSATELVAFYRERLPGLGFTVVHESAAPDGSSGLIYFQNDEYSDASVQGHRNAGTTNVVISLPIRD